MRYIEYTVLTTTEASDAVAYLLEREGAVGIAIEDPNDFLFMNKDKHSWDYVSPNLLEGLNDDVKVIGYFNGFVADLEESVMGLKKFGLDVGKGQVIVSNIDDGDWANVWKEHFKPFKVGNRIIIKPTWENYKGHSDDIIVEIDPGMAFGTGDHETTFLCLQLLEKYMSQGVSIVDVGCGSGILGIAAAKLGAKEVLCIDIDDNACKVAKDNTILNRVDETVTVRKGYLLDNAKVKYDIVIANIVADIIISLSGQALDFLKNGGYFISSGIITDRKDDVKNSLKKHGFEIVEALTKGEWCAIVAKR